MNAWIGRLPQHINKRYKILSYLLQVSKDEELPRGVCNSCYDLLKNYSDFKRTCLQSQATLLDILTNKSFKYEVDVQVTHRTENYDLNETLNDNIKVEVIDGVIKSENGDDHGIVFIKNYECLRYCNFSSILHNPSI